MGISGISVPFRFRNVIGSPSLLSSFLLRPVGKHSLVVARSLDNSRSLSVMLSRVLLSLLAVGASVARAASTGCPVFDADMNLYVLGGPSDYVLGAQSGWSSGACPQCGMRVAEDPTQRRQRRSRRLASARPLQARKPRAATSPSTTTPSMSSAPTLHTRLAFTS